MTFLPIVGRELRVAARRRGTYWVRLGVALTAIFLGAIILFVNLGAPPAKLGQYMFLGLSVLCFVYCIAAGRISTADCLSEEKRDGTLGLLFLTDLKGYDIVLGKLVATSVSSFYGLLAVLPVLGIPMLMGGITNGEFWRIVVVLANTFLYSLAIGIFGSALSWDGRRAMATNFALLLTLFVGLPGSFVLAIHYSGLAVTPDAFIFSPIFSFYASQDFYYKTNASDFWTSVGIVHGMTWLLLVLAGRIVPRTWQDKPAPLARARKMSWREVWIALSHGTRSKRAPFRKRLLDVNAYYWLAARARLKPHHVYIFLGLAAAWWEYCRLKARIEWNEPLLTVPTAILVNSTIKLWIALEASQQLAEDQRAGALELLLSTPLTVWDILRGQLLALRRQFLIPLLLVVVCDIFFMWGSVRATPQESQKFFFIWGASIFMMVADIAALIFVAMRVALTAKSTHRAIIGTVSRILVLPWVIFGTVTAVVMFWTQLPPITPWSPDWSFHLSVWFGAGILVDLFFGIIAWRQLCVGFRALATKRFASEPSILGRGRAKRNAKAAGIETMEEPARGIFGNRKLIVFGAAAGLVAGYFYFFSEPKPNFPPPVTVRLSQSNAPLRIFPSVNAFLILPDGSLWRWGGVAQGIFTRAVMPERVGTNHNWAEAHGVGDLFVGIQKDGTLWQWGRVHQPGTNQMQTQNVLEPEQVGSESNWLSVSTAGAHSVAIKRDGTLWWWGNNMWGGFGNGAHRGFSDLVQVGTNSDWAEVNCLGSYTSLLRTNGTLWVWGRVYASSPGRSGGALKENSFSAPVQVCRETNWTSLAGSFGLWAWTSSGELWQTLRATPDAEASVGANGRLIATNSGPNRLILILNSSPTLYEIQTDGTLWESSAIAVGPFAGNLNPVWHRVGYRSDWVKIWSISSTGLGLTADGTIWMWGLDFTQVPKTDARWKLKLIKDKIKNTFTGQPKAGTSGGPMAGAWPPIQNEPRPLMILIGPGEKNPVDKNKK